jgi:hypothetical protein
VINKHTKKMNNVGGGKGKIVVKIGDTKKYFFKKNDEKGGGGQAAGRLTCSRAP